MKKVLILAAGLSFVTASAFAAVSGSSAVLSSVSGSIKVKQGGRIIRGTEGLELANGNVVTVVGKGSVLITYNNSCRVQVKTRSSVVIGPNLCSLAGAEKIAEQTPQLAAPSTSPVPLPVVAGIAGVAGVGTVAAVVAGTQSNGSTTRAIIIPPVSN